jgi:hypothetical protein
MNAIFSQSGYLIKRQGLAISGKYKVFGQDGKEALLFVEEKSTLFPLAIKIHIYADEKKKQEILTMKDRPDGNSDEMDVLDAENGQKIGALVMNAESVAEIFKDVWSILDWEDKPVGKVFDTSLAKSIVRDVIGHSIPQNMQIKIGEIVVGEIHQKLKAFGYELELDFSKDVSALLDRRIGIAIGLLVAYAQGRETD